MNSRYWLKRALQRAGASRAPNRIPMSGTDRLRKRDYYTVTLDSDRDDNFLFERIEGDTVVVRQWNGHIYPEETLSLPIQQFVGRPIEIRYYLRQYEFMRVDARAFEVGSVLGWYRFISRLHDFSQGAYNNKSLATRRRFDLLQLLVAEALDDRDKSLTVYFVLTELYGKKVVLHPRFRQLLNYYNLLLESLRDEGLLTNADDGSYRLAPKALTALNSYEDEERRHRDNQKTQRTVMRITYVAGAATVIQALAVWGQVVPTLISVKDWLRAALGL